MSEDKYPTYRPVPVNPTPTMNYGYDDTLERQEAERRTREFLNNKTKQWQRRKR